MSTPSPAPGRSVFSLLETMRLEDGTVPRRDRHLARASATAVHFGFAWDTAAIAGALDAAVGAHPTGTWRLRLLLSASGAPTAECLAHTHDGSRVWRVALAALPVDSHDERLRHKTTHRDLYDDARASRPDVDDVLLWNERGEVTESTIANVVAEIDGRRGTPALSCGLLPGVFRAALLDAGEIQERVITKADLELTTRLWLVNSLREWIPAALAR